MYNSWIFPLIGPTIAASFLGFLMLPLTTLAQETEQEPQQSNELSEDWVEITVNTVGDRFLVNRNSIQLGGNSVGYWQYREFRQPNNEFVNAFVEDEITEPVFGVMMYMTANCPGGVERLRRLVVFDENRQVIERFDYGEAGSLTQPREGSSAAAVLEFACGQMPQNAQQP